MTSIVLVEDDQELACWIAEYLRAKQYHVTVYHDGKQAYEALHRHIPDLVILDGMLPSMDGLDICKLIRLHSQVPIIMLTARDEEIDEILGLEMGADDYLTKPVRGRLLETRIKSLLRRTGPSHPERLEQDVYTLGELTICKSARTAELGGTHLKLSTNEFDVLWILAQHAGNVVSRESLSQQLRGFEYDGFDRTIDLRISRLRKKLMDDAAEPYKIKTIWGKGYLLAPEVSH
ncbi:response regulator transcription factor [Pseudoalteromonas xiamenensis]|uniref:response regulator transcription factor n=1 Tax=Pseudoalteromonas xiamenensis TaxID=882626 RepID=UPI0027E4878E|nr:response regulator transcription factor [Pseudoalteromonas xiamenensis]WMN60744.1 response regulator transcription factor [Pseudoalteromonas xiamenensis]